MVVVPTRDMVAIVVSLKLERQQCCRRLGEEHWHSRLLEMDSRIMQTFFEL